MDTRLLPGSNVAIHFWRGAGAVLACMELDPGFQDGPADFRDSGIPGRQCILAVSTQLVYTSGCNSLERKSPGYRNPFNAPTDKRAGFYDDGKDLYGGASQVTDLSRSAYQFTIQADLFSKAIRENSGSSEFDGGCGVQHGR